MIDDLHIVDFCNDVGRIFLLLHRLFPRQQELYIGDLIGYEDPDEYGLYSKRHESCLSTLIWLKTEGWIRFDSVVRREAVDQCVITQDAFVRLHTNLPRSLAQRHFTDTTEADSESPANLRLIDALYLGRKAQDSAAIHSTVMHLLAAGTVTGTSNST